MAEALIYNGWGDKIFHTYLVDSKAVPGQHFGQPVPLGEGDNYIEQFRASFDYLNIKLKELGIA